MDEIIKGLGNDIVEIERISDTIDRYQAHFLNRLFTNKEQDYCLKYKNSSTHFAGRHAAKEAIAKAFGVGIGEKIGWHDLEILNDDLGKPYLIISDKLKKLFNNPRVALSISHCKEYALATAIWY